MTNQTKIKLDGYEAALLDDSGNTKTGRLALGTWGSYGTEELAVTLGELWEDCTTIAATFAPDSPAMPWDTKGTQVLLADGVITVPPEATKKPTQTGTVTFWGVGDGVKVVSASLRYTVAGHAAAFCGEESTATPSLLDQVLTQTGKDAAAAEAAAQEATGAVKAAPYIGDNGNWYVWDSETGAFADSGVAATGPQGETGATGATGAAGYTPVRGTDYWTDDDIATIKSYVDDAILKGTW